MIFSLTSIIFRIFLAQISILAPLGGVSSILTSILVELFTNIIDSYVFDQDQPSFPEFDLQYELFDEIILNADFLLFLLELLVQPVILAGLVNQLGEHCLQLFLEMNHLRVSGQYFFLFDLF